MHRWHRDMISFHYPIVEWQHDITSTTIRRGTTVIISPSLKPIFRSARKLEFSRWPFNAPPKMVLYTWEMLEAMNDQMRTTSVQFTEGH